MNKVIGYGLVTKGEAKRYMRATLEEFKRLCDDTILLLNNVGQAERKLIKEYGFKTFVDNREWGLNQQRIKQDFITNQVSKLVDNPESTWCVGLDMDEVFEKRFNRQELEKLTSEGWGFHFFVVNLWGEGHKPRRNFWNVRVWKWTGNCVFENKPLHPGLAPKWAYQINQYAPFILRHYGLKLKEDRMKKVARYEKYDPNMKYCSPEYYRDLLTDDFEPYDEDKLHDEVDAEVKKYKPKITRKPIIMPKEEFYEIRRTNILTGETYTFPANKQQCEFTLKQSGQNGYRFELMGKVEDLQDEMKVLFAPKEATEEVTVAEPTLELTKKAKRVKKTK